MNGFYYITYLTQSETFGVQISEKCLADAIADISSYATILKVEKRDRYSLIAPSWLPGNRK